LTLEQAVDATHLLLLAQTQAVLTHLEATLAMLTGRVRTTRHRTLLGKTTIALEEQLCSLTTTQLANWTNVTSHKKSWN
jgi:hypothetical protein